MQTTSFEIVPIVAILSVVGGFVTIVGMIINAIVKIKIAKYNSLQRDQKPDEASGTGVWPPAPKP